MKLGRRLANGTGIIKAAATDAFASDFQTSRDTSFVRVTIAVTAAGVADFYVLIPNSGNSLGLNGAAALQPGVVYVEDVPVDPDRTWNVQAVTTGITADIMVQELSMVA